MNRFFLIPYKVLVVLSLIQLLIQYPCSILTALCHPPCIHCLLQPFANCSKTLLCPVSPFPPSPLTLHVTSWVYYLLPQATGFQPPLAYSISVNFITILVYYFNAAKTNKAFTQLCFTLINTNVVCLWHRCFSLKSSSWTERQILTPETKEQLNREINFSK
jgi:hypothetical protein